MTKEYTSTITFADDILLIELTYERPHTIADIGLSLEYQLLKILPFEIVETFQQPHATYPEHITETTYLSIMHSKPTLSPEKIKNVPRYALTCLLDDVQTYKQQTPLTSTQATLLNSILQQIDQILEDR